MAEKMYKIWGHYRNGQYGWLCNMSGVDADDALRKARNIYGSLYATGVQAFDEKYDDPSKMIDPEMKG